MWSNNNIPMENDHFILMEYVILSIPASFHNVYPCVDNVR